MPNGVAFQPWNSPRRTAWHSRPWNSPLKKMRAAVFTRYEAADAAALAPYLACNFDD
jgi:hypothetical protein